MIYNTELLKYVFSDFNDANILVKGNITIAAHNLAIDVAFKNYESFCQCIINFMEEQKIMLKI